LPSKQSKNKSKDRRIKIGTRFSKELGAANSRRNPPRHIRPLKLLVGRVRRNEDFPTYLRRAEALRLAWRVRRTVLRTEFVCAVRMDLCRRTGFGITRLAFLATFPNAATCPSVDPICSATAIKTCFSLSTKPLALFM
jgi:hypothetical protein